MTAQHPGRGSGSGLRKQRRDALGPRKDIIFRLPEDLAHQLKLVVAHEKTTVQEFCEQAVIPLIRQGLKKHGLSAESIDR